MPPIGDKRERIVSNVELRIEMATTFSTKCDDLSVTLDLQNIVKNTRKRTMRTFYGAVTEINDLGTVAEHCPHCANSNVAY